MYTAFPIYPILPADNIRYRRGEVTLEQLRDGHSLLIYANHCRYTFIRMLALFCAAVSNKFLDR